MPFRFLLFTMLLLVSSCIKSQNKNAIEKLVGGPCQGCEAIYEYGDKFLNSVDTLPGFITSNQKIKISGTIYKKDGKTPAKDVILYAYHTDEKGIYPKRSSSKGWERRHGYLRGWIKTDASGNYSFYTNKPASYPKTSLPQHIHITVKEPDKNEYYISDVYFSNDPNLTDDIKNKKNHRGGNSIVKLRENGQLLEAKRDIILGLHIPNYN
jgi:protocatechuate 3,4-dioxygenase beta subunit